MEFEVLGALNAGYSFAPEKASYRIIPNGHGWRVCIVKQSSAGNYLCKFTNAKTGAVVKEKTMEGSWSYFTLTASEAKDGLIFESKSTTASQILFADAGWYTPDKV